MIRSTAGERRADAARVALAHFAHGGYDGTSVAPIAAAIGVSQPYLFKLFTSKSELFIACVELCYDLIEGHAREKLAAAKAEGRAGSLADVSSAYRQTIADSSLLMFQLHAWAASGSHPEIRAVVARRFSQTLVLSQELTGASTSEVNDLFARGARLVVTSVLDIELLD